MIAIVAVGGQAATKEQASARKAVYINQTADHKTDRALRGATRWFQDWTKINVGVVLLDRLPPNTTIEAHADKLFADLKLGRKTDGKALLFVWAEEERLFKIEVSYDLEDVFPDALCKRLEEGARTFMLMGTSFARRDFIVELLVTMKLHYLEKGNPASFPIPDAGKRYVGGYLSGGAGMVGRGYAATVANVQRELQSLPAELERDMQPGRTPQETLARYLLSLELGIGAPNLPLVTEASRYFRMDKPHAPGYLKRIRAYIAKSKQPQIRVQGDLAAAVFGVRDPVLPILMRRDAAGFWFVDEPKVWAAYHLFQDGSSNIKYANMAYGFAALPWPSGMTRDPIFDPKVRTPPLMPLSGNLQARLAWAEALVQWEPDNVEAWIALANLLHFEMFWIQASEAAYERIVRLAPDRMDMRWRLIDMYEMSSDADNENLQWCEILKREPGNPIAVSRYRHFRNSYYAEDPGTATCPYAR